MEEMSVRPTDNVETIVHTYGTPLYRLCFVMLGNKSDAEDAVQDTVIRYLQKAPALENEQHTKAWLIVTAKNICRDMLRARKRRMRFQAEALREILPEETETGILEALMSLPERFRVVLTLYYVEEYSVAEIAKVISRTPSAVKMRLQKGRKLLEEKYRKEYL